MTETSHATPQARVKTPHPFLALMGLYLGGFVGMYSETALNIALPQLSAAFGIELSLVQWLVIGYMLAIGIVLPFASAIMKWFSARAITMFALGSFALGAVASGIAPNFGLALAGRIVQGVGTGLVLPLMFAMVLEVMPPHKIGAAMGITALVIMFAPAIGPTLAGFLIGALSWRWVFFSFAAVALVGLAFAAKFEVNPYTLSRPHIDAASVVASCLGFGGIVLCVGVSSLLGWTSPVTLGAFVVGVAGLVVYVRRQLSSETPVLDLRAFRIRDFRIGSLCVMVNFGITLAAMYILPQFYQNAMAIAVVVTGVVMLPGGVVNCLVSVVSGRLFDHVGARVPAIAGFALSAVGAAMLLFVSPDSSIGYVVACHIVLMVGVPLAMSPCQTHALSSLPARLSTDGSTILNTMQQVVGAICTAVATGLIANGQQSYFAAGGADATLAFSQGAHAGFLFVFALAACGLILSIRLKTPSKQAERAEAACEVQPVLSASRGSQAARIAQTENR